MTTTFNYKKWNNLIGWIVFTISLITYTLTLEPTVSFWDCGEYISTSVKLEVGHPPGAPLFQMLGAFFAIFSNNPQSTALMVNFLSALSSAFTILFLFWSLTILIHKISKNSHPIVVLGSAVIGSLSYTFSDSFWFSAVEAEVYAMSSFLMALLFWLALKWENSFHQPYSNKWLILICFIIGLSFGVHVLTLLVIPSIAFIYLNKYYQKYTFRNFIIANIIAIGFLIFFFKIYFPYTLAFFSLVELFFVNNIGLPFNSGTVIAGLILITLFYYGLKATKNKNKPMLNTILLCLLFTMLGFSSWLLLPIRSNANTIINENNPSSARELLAYYNREQYGDANIFYDTYYSSKYDTEPAKDSNGNIILEDAKPKYEKDEKSGKYIIVNDYENAVEKTSDKHKGFIPRMVSPSFESNYKNIAGITQNSQARPTMFQNLYYMVSYQFNYMYFRYLFWNFIGKQNDNQGNLDLLNGNFITGFSFIDKYIAGPQENLPTDALQNKGRNIYYGIPFILGLIGIWYQYQKDKRNFYNLLLFFVFTSFAIIFYTNPKPFEPRERDYAVVGSFYIFTIWIGFGVFALFDMFKKHINTKPKQLIALSILLLASPVLMAKENWDDHDRSNKYTARFNAKAYLDSCAKDAIIFTIGDNDTFPLWYMQEVENYRTDIKIINTSLLATDWYIDQMKRQTYNAKPIPSKLTHDLYKHGTLDIAYGLIQTEERWDIKDFMRWIATKDKRTYVEVIENKFEKYYPTHKLRIQVDKSKVLKNKLVTYKDKDLIVDYIDIDIDERGLTKNRILMLDILANNNWERPLYFTGGSNNDDEYIWLKDYLQLDGLAYKFVPIKTKDEYGVLGLGRIDTNIMYQQIKSWDFGYKGKPFYLDPESRKNSISYRNNISRLVEVYINNGNLKKAEEVLDISYNKMPIREYQEYGVCIGFPELYYLVGNPTKAQKSANELIKTFQEHLIYFNQFNEHELESIFGDLEQYFKMYQTVVADIQKYDTNKTYKEKTKKEFIQHIQLFESILGTD